MAWHPSHGAHRNNGAPVSWKHTEVLTAGYFQGIGVYFFTVNIPRKTAYFEEKIHREVE
jgi:hypothetical protein